MKLPLILASLVLAASSAFGTVTLQFNTAAGSLQNFANGAGAGGTAMVWGIIIDTSGNGFNFHQNPYYAPTISYTAAVAQPLFNVWGDLTDDVLFLAPNLMNVQGAVADGMPAGTNRVTSLAAVPYGSSSIDAGDPFAVVWLNSSSIPSGQPLAGGNTLFGAVTHAGFIIPADGSTTSFAHLFAGPDPLKTQNYIFGFPEPSTSLLGLLGATTLLRRRR